MAEYDTQPSSQSEPRSATTRQPAERTSYRWQWILGIALALVGAVDEVNQAIFGDRRTTGGMIFTMLLAGVLAGRAFDRWKDRTLYHLLYFVPLGVLLGLAARALLIGPLP